MATNTTPGYIHALGLGDDPTTQQAFSLLDQIIGRQGGTDPARLASVRQNIKRRNTSRSGAGLGGARQNLLANLAAGEAGIQDQRRLGDLQLVDALLTKPAIARRELDIQKLRGKLQRKGAKLDTRRQLFGGISGLLTMAAGLRSAYKNRE